MKKSAEEWVNENSQSGAFDLIDDCKTAEQLVENIQLDAVAEFVEVIRAMHNRDDAYGSGFYNDDEWQRSYQRLRHLAGMAAQE